MKNFISFLLLLVSCSVFGQKATISGYIHSEKTGEPLLSASIFESVHGKGTTSNSSGFFSLTSKTGKLNIKVSFIGFETADLILNLQNDTLLNIYLSEQNLSTNEIVVSGSKLVHERTLMDRTLVPVRKIETYPSISGQPDLLKAITAIPGITGGREGYANIMVRGGDRGQNLILLDGAKLYSTNHLGGMISLFNTDAIKQVEVYKGGFPSRYGDRLSSVIDVTTSEGNRNKMNGRFSLGITSSGLSIDGPIGKKVTYMFAARSSYLDLLQIGRKKSIENQDEASFLAYTFYDLNAKLTYNVTQKNKWSLAGYMGTDYFRSIQKSNNNYSFNSIERYSNRIKNIILNLSNQRNLSSKLFLRSNLSATGYINLFAVNSLQTGMGDSICSEKNLNANILEINGQSRLEYFASNVHTIRSGIEFSHYQFVPGVEISNFYNSNAGIEFDTAIGYTNPINAREFSIYLEDDIKLSENNQLNVGVRSVLYSCNGHHFTRFEPRISFRSIIGENLSAKANYTLMHQFNHVLINNITGIERELWLTSTENVPPQKGQQCSGGLFYSFPKKHIELSLEGYWKTMSHLLEYYFPSNGDIVLTNIEEMVYKEGHGLAYGAEFQANYKGRQMDLALNYVLSWNFRQFDQLNDGKWYPFLYDRRHNVSLLSHIVFNKMFSLNANFIYSTGTRVSLPDAYVQGDKYSKDYYIFSEINNRRLPDYHRLDLSIVKTSFTKKKREQQLTIGAYNAYARKNATYIYFENGKIIQKSMFSIIPSISYSLKF